MNTKKTIIILFIAFALIACKSNNKKQNNMQDKHDSIPDELLSSTNKNESFDSIHPELEKFLKMDPLNQQQNDSNQPNSDSDNREGLIEITDYRKTEKSSVVKEIYLNESELPDSLLKIAAVAEKFIKWYVNDSCPINQHYLFPFSDSLGYYTFDAKYCRFYLSELKKTGIVSDRFILELQEYLEQIRVDMENEQYDRDIDFAIDLIFNSQDPPMPYMVQEMKLESFTFFSTNEILVRFDGAAVMLINENGEWKVVGE